MSRSLLVMGILNVTPDSFSDGGAHATPEAAVAHGLRLVEEGADLLDIGGESSRPGARAIRATEELKRVLPVISRLARRVRVPLSIDTTKAQVAQEALAAGASMVNDISALRADPQMTKVVARSPARVILMHRRGTPQTMQRHPRYADVVGYVATFLTQAAQQAQAHGIARARILIDPGLGFGKTLTQNLQLMRALDRFVALGYPVVVGPSRKSFIGATLDAQVHERLAGTLACVAWAQQAGARMVRVHDVKPAVDLIRMLQAIEGAHATRRQR